MNYLARQCNYDEGRFAHSTSFQQETGGGVAPDHYADDNQLTEYKTAWKVLIRGIKEQGLEKSKSREKKD